MTIFPRSLSGACLLLALGAGPLFAQDQAPATPPVSSNPDSRIDPLQPDFTIAALPTTLRLPEHKSAFRVTHRFTRSLGRGDFGDLVSDFFGFDSGAQIGLEYRFGLMPGTQIAFHRTSNRTIQLLGQQNLLQQKADGAPIGLDVLATLEGTNNLRGQKMSAIGVVVSRKVAKVAALYAEPMLVINTNAADGGSGVSNNTAMVGLGARVRIRPAVYLVGEVTPRLAGYKPGVDQGSFGIEMRAGGHSFQINFSNGFGTTLGQLATGGVSSDSWFIGFNISRKFF